MLGGFHLERGEVMEKQHDWYHVGPLEIVIEQDCLLVRADSKLGTAYVRDTLKLKERLDRSDSLNVKGTGLYEIRKPENIIWSIIFTALVSFIFGCLFMKIFY
jgi:hypothetical protein